MGRIGIRPDDEGLSFVKKAMNTKGVTVEGMFTHFAKADEKDPVPTREQIALYTGFRKRIARETGREIPICHCSNSAGIIEFPEANMDLVRAGITLYGLWPSDEVGRTAVPLKPVMTLYSHIVYIKEAGPGVSVSYGGTFTTSREMTRIATIPVGYGDGYPEPVGEGICSDLRKRAPIRKSLFGPDDGGRNGYSGSGGREPLHADRYRLRGYDHDGRPRRSVRKIQL